MDGIDPGDFLPATDGHRQALDTALEDLPYQVGHERTTGVGLKIQMANPLRYMLETQATLLQRL